ncbi:MAG TPA: glycosyltransferase family 4 protein [Cellvibrionaceae bacterium]
MNESQILLMFHCQQFTGYAIGVLEQAFKEAAYQAGFKEENIFWCFSQIIKPAPRTFECEYKNSSHASTLDAFLTKHNIQIALAFDLGYPAVASAILKKHGVKIISYWGASMSSLNNGLVLLGKKIEWLLRADKPDYFIFESEAMRRTATNGRGIPYLKTCVIPLGVDTEKFFPDYENYFYAHEKLNIPANSKIIFYSGHMEERKGVRVIMHAAIKLFDADPTLPIHFVICGNKDGEEQTFLTIIKQTSAQEHVTFAGYRTDINQLMRSSSIGVIASTGWDSFTMSSVEMMSSGLPLIVSNLQGLAETIDSGTNGLLLTPGNADELAQKIALLTSDDLLRQRFSLNSRKRALELFSKNEQIKRISHSITSTLTR